MYTLWAVSFKVAVGVPPLYSLVHPTIIYYERLSTLLIENSWKFRKKRHIYTNLFASQGVDCLLRRQRTLPCTHATLSSGTPFLLTQHPEAQGLYPMYTDDKTKRYNSKVFFCLRAGVTKNTDRLSCCCNHPPPLTDIHPNK